MLYKISGRHLDIGEALSEHVETTLGAAISKYAERPTEAKVTFSQDAHELACEVTVHLSTGLTAHAKSRASEIYASFDSCCEKMEKQLRRYKRRLKNHHKERLIPVESSDASSYILAASNDSREPEEPETLQPVIIAEIEARVPMLTVGEAVMQMEIANSSVLVFRNQAHDRVNVVYRRDDGNFGWIDPHDQSTPST